MASSAWLSSAAPSARAVNGMFAGRVPGITTELDENGFYTYTRPNGKGGGHGVGWSEFPPYTFLVPPGWDEVPVSIADLVRTELQHRHALPVALRHEVQLDHAILPRRNVWWDPEPTVLLRPVVVTVAGDATIGRHRGGPALRVHGGKEWRQPAGGDRSRASLRRCGVQR
eukprot:scaffold1646_cov384-Prasinococcus_capsulatus_cf.AAC.11